MIHRVQFYHLLLAHVFRSYYLNFNQQQTHIVEQPPSKVLVILVSQKKVRYLILYAHTYLSFYRSEVVEILRGLPGAQLLQTSSKQFEKSSAET